MCRVEIRSEGGEWRCVEWRLAVKVESGGGE